ncbi:unnamed protein product [Clonostachys solani]|uniref:Uncharacterized protein n=1 Tax=Clonostachys solani TaxID=160281 RepID=A0A9N9YYM9_9HYPO|nr:unnamed protein product [Clonostachys solani]
MAPRRKSVLITGCSAGGIGAGLAEGFCEKGYHVFATARTTSKISQGLASASNVTVLELDVLKPESIAAAVESVKQKTGGTLDVLINNSGQAAIAPALDVSIEEGKKVFDLNFWAPLAILQAFSPLLIEAKGCLVNNASCSAYLPMALMSRSEIKIFYNGSSDIAALISASDTWRRELKPLGVRTITLATSSVGSSSTPTLSEVKIPETSHYYGIKDFVEGVPGLLRQPGAITPRNYAARVIREVEKGTSGTIWVGTSAEMGKLGYYCFPQSVLDMVIESVLPFDKAMAQAAKK